MEHSFEWYMKQWIRICKAHDDEVREKGLEPHCDGCPINETGYDCMAVFEYADEEDKDKVTNFAAIAKAIEEWAAKHPEPKYPRWGEWALWMDIIRILGTDREGKLRMIPGDAYNRRIPEAIANKLGIKPKEG